MTTELGSRESIMAAATTLCNNLERAERLIAKYHEALTRIASYKEGPEVNSSFDEPESAKIARAALEATEVIP
jgi:hypothetical protein